jgi:hypothetical protein
VFCTPDKFMHSGWLLHREQNVPALLRNGMLNFLFNTDVEYKSATQVKFYTCSNARHKEATHSLYHIKV